MIDLTISQQAEQDIEGIGEWGVSMFGPIPAVQHLDGMYRIFTLLREHPRAGEARPRWGNGIRSMSHRPHRILYRIDDDVILIVRILHMSRDVRRTLRHDR